MVTHYSSLRFLLKVDVNIDVQQDQLSNKGVNLAIIGGLLLVSFLKGKTSGP